MNILNIALMILCGFANPAIAATPAKIDAQKLIARAEQQSLGSSFQGQLKMTLIRPEGNRELELLLWTEGRDKALVKLLSPPKDRGTANLRLKFNLWQYLPHIERVIKIPASLMLQSWMGSDFTNDDLVKSSRISRDYTNQFVGFEKLHGVRTAKIVCHPKPDAPVVWGHLVLWIDPQNAVLMQQEFYSENGELLKRLTGSDIRKFGSHTIAAKLSITTLKKKTTTTLQYVKAKFDVPLKRSLFTQSSLKAPLKE